jgi:hypothetical protein
VPSALASDAAAAIPALRQQRLQGRALQADYAKPHAAAAAAATAAANAAAAAAAASGALGDVEKESVRVSKVSKATAAPAARTAPLAPAHKHSGRLVLHNLPFSVRMRGI